MKSVKHKRSHGNVSFGGYVVSRRGLAQLRDDACHESDALQRDGHLRPEVSCGYGLSLEGIRGAKSTPHHFTVAKAIVNDISEGWGEIEEARQIADLLEVYYG